MFDLKGRVAVITGASSGLGKQMAEAFAEQGADLVVLARRMEKLEELKIKLEEKDVKVLPIKCYEASYVTGVILLIDGGYTCV